MRQIPPRNVYGHIIRWRESDPAATTFEWDVFVLAGDPAQTDPTKKGDINGDIFGSPDALAFDPRGLLWIGTDISASSLAGADYTRFGSNQLLAADPNTREARRFLVGPRGAEITGMKFTHDGSTMFVSIQHPGEPASKSDPANPKAISSWPDGPSARCPPGSDRCRARRRVERANLILQDRLVKELRLRGTCSIEAGNEYLPAPGRLQQPLRKAATQRA